MEKLLIKWMKKRSKLKMSSIQRKAKILSENENFKASRGWYRNFVKRNQNLFESNMIKAKFYPHKSCYKEIIVVD